MSRKVRNIMGVYLTACKCSAPNNSWSELSYLEPQQGRVGDGFSKSQEDLQIIVFA